jgi:hypothetical protein
MMRGKMRLEINNAPLQYSQRNTHDYLFRVEMLTIFGCNFNHITVVIYLCYKVIEVDLGLFTAFPIKSFQKRFVASNW